MIREVRMIKGATLRTLKRADDKPGIAGIAAVYSQTYDTGWFVESIEPGAFTRALQEKQDVRCLFNHNVDHVLARTKNGTMRLEDSAAGLKFDADTDPETSIGRDVPRMIDRGDIDGCSFAFTVRKDSWEDEYDESGRYVNTYRKIQDVDLYDVGPVTYPAYDATSVDVRTNNGLRSMGESRMRQLWPEGLPDEFRGRIVRGVWRPAPKGAPADAKRDFGMCMCSCAECIDGDCENCTHVDCDCADCQCDAAQGRAKAGDLLTLRARAHMAGAAAISRD
jgi:HK97 family phage prohead protease